MFLSEFLPIFIHLIPILIGWFLICLWQKNIRIYFIEKIGLSYGLGALLITFSIFVLSFFGFKFSQFNILLLTIFLLFLSILISRIYSFHPLSYRNFNLLKFRPHQSRARCGTQIGTGADTTQHQALLWCCPTFVGRSDYGRRRPKGDSARLKGAPIWPRSINYQSKKIKSIFYQAFLCLLILIILFKIVFVFSEAYLKPVFQSDTIANWALRAKVFFVQEKIPLNPSHPYYLGGGGHENYPLHLPLFKMWATKILGSWDEKAIVMISAFYYLSLIIIFYYALIRLIRKDYAIIFTFFLASLPFLVYHGFSAYADLPLTFYLTVSVLYGFIGLREKNFSYLLLTSIFAAGLVWTKNEGLFLSLIILFSATFCWLIKKQWKTKFFIFYFLFFIFILPWLIFMIIHRLGFSNVGTIDNPQLNPWKIGFYGQSLKFIFKDLGRNDCWHFLWLIFILSPIFFFKKFFASKNLFLLISIFGFLVFYFSLYFFTAANFEYISRGYILNRNLLAVAPSALFFLGLLKFVNIEI